jgi:hypothetical protein
MEVYMNRFIAAVSLFGLASVGAAGQGTLPTSLDGSWKATFADSVSSGNAFLYISTQSDGSVSGKYMTTLDTKGAITGKIDGRNFQFTLIQLMEECPGSITGSMTLQGEKGVGTYTGSDCRGAHENGVISIERSEDKESPAGGLVKPGQAPQELLLPKEVAEERKQAEADCPKCPRIFITYINSDSGKVEDWALTDPQREWISKYKNKGWKGKGKGKGKGKPRFWFTRHKANADYIFIWTQAEGSKPYIYYVPRTETETLRTTGTFQGTVQVEKKSTEEKQGTIYFVDAVLTIWDSGSGKKLHEVRHRGKWRWSKPQKDCIQDAIKYLRSYDN